MWQYSHIRKKSPEVGRKEVLSKRASRAQNVRWHGADSEQARNSARELAEAKIADYIERTLAAAPPLTDQQRTALAELLKPVRIGGAG